MTTKILGKIKKIEIRFCERSFEFYFCFIVLLTLKFNLRFIKKKYSTICSRKSRKDTTKPDPAISC